MLVGRSAEEQRVASLLDHATAGSSNSLLISGPPGIGKTALVGRTVELARDRGMVVLRARGIEAEADVPFAGLSDLLGPVLERRAALESLHRRTLGVALGLEEGTRPQPFAVAVALLALVGDAAGDLSHGLLVAVDDAQWLDPGSLEALLFAVRRLHAEGAAVVISARPEPDRGLFERGLDGLELAALAPDAALELVQRASGSAPARPAAEILELAAGYPLLLIELARLEDTASYPRVPGDVRPTEAIKRAFEQDLAGLPAQTRDALVAVAADGRITRAQARAAVAALELPADALDAADRAGTFAADCDRLDFRHPLLRHVIYYRATSRWRATVHGVLAEIVDDDFRAAWHLGQAVEGPDSRAAEALESAAKGALDRGDLAIAAHAYVHSARLTPQPEASVPRALAAAELSMLTGSLQDSLEIAEAALANPVAEPGLRADLERIRGTVLGRTGELQTAFEPLVAQADRVAAGDPARAVVLLLGACAAVWFIGDFERLRAFVGRADELAGAERPELGALVGLMRSLLLASTGRIAQAEEAVASSEWVLDRPGLPDPGYELMGTPALVSIWTGRLDRAARLVDRQLARSRREGAVAELTFPLNVRGQIDIRMGRADRSLAAAGEAFALARDTGQKALEGLALSALTHTEGLLGREADCRAHAAAALELAHDSGAIQIEVTARSALAALELSLGNVEASLVASLHCARIAERTGLIEPNVARWHGDRIEALVRSGRARDAARLTADVEAHLARSATTWTRATVERARGLLAPGDAGAERFEAAIVLLDGAGDLLEAARVRLTLGERLRRAKRRRDAREPLAAALDVFTRVGAEPWAGRAEAELRAAGGGNDANGVGGVQSKAAIEDLTAHELRIALLVADGMTNPEVAADLFLSRKTVEFHLSAVYRKLGIRSRTQLARALG